MNRVEIKERAKASLEGKLGESIKVILVLAAVGFVTGFITKVGTEVNSNALIILSDIISFVATSMLSFGSLSFFLKLSRDEEVTYKEVFEKTNMFLPYIIISLVSAIFSLLWGLLFIIPGIIAAISYSQAMFIKLDNPDMDEIECIRKSKEIMNGHKLDYFILNLSFIGWAFLGIFTFGILYIWLIPYISLAQANFYNSLIENK